MKIPPLMTPNQFDVAWRNAQKQKESPKPVEGAFHFDAERLLNVLRALEDGDISECKAPDVKHAIEAMTRIFFLADLVPDFLDGFVEIATKHFAKMHQKALLGELAQKKADEEGYGEEWRAAIEAGKTPNKKDYMARMVELMMKAKGLNQNQAIEELARQAAKGDEAPDVTYSRENSIRRTVTRSKKRRKGA